jgi:hypothetical protein
MQLSVKRTYLDSSTFAKRILRRSEAAVKFCERHLLHPITGAREGPLPRWGSLKPFTPPAINQGQEGSCTACSFCGAYRTLCRYLGNKDEYFVPSPSYYYFHERLAEDPAGDPSDLTDSGADEVDGLEWAKTHGVCSEQSWPYIPDNMNTPPPVECESEATAHRIAGYTVIPIDDQLITNIEATICSGKPVLIAIDVYSSFEGEGPAKTGMIPIPKPQNWGDPQDPDDAYMGGHEMCLVGYDTDKKLFTVLNSWGTEWGAGGFCYIPYDYLSNPNLGRQFTVMYF